MQRAREQLLPVPVLPESSPTRMRRDARALRTMRSICGSSPAKSSSARTSFAPARLQLHHVGGAYCASISREPHVRRFMAQAAKSAGPTRHRAPPQPRRWVPPDRSSPRRAMSKISSIRGRSVRSAARRRQPHRHFVAAITVASLASARARRAADSRTPAGMESQHAAALKMPQNRHFSMSLADR